MSGFFGFDTNVPSLGAGKFDDLDAALPDDDEIDIVNDETFGAGAVFDGDWEEAHEKLAEQLETFKYEGHGHHRTSSFGNGQNHRYEDDALGALREDDFHQSDTFTSQEDDLEKSLSQLVVDDDEIDDPAIMNLSKNRPIPQAKNNNLDNLFGPSSPPAFLNTEHLVSPGKTNIWGSPATRDSYLEPTPPTDDGGIKNLLNMLKVKTPAQPGPFQDPSIVMAGKPTPIANARNLDELEQELINGKSPSSGPGVGPVPVPKNNNRPMTVEDLEREMRGQPIPTPPGGRPQHQGQAPIGTPPQVGYMQHHMQRMSGNKPNMARSTSPGQHFSSSPHAPGYSHSTAPITIAKRGTPPSTGFQAQTSVLAALMHDSSPVSLPTPHTASPSPSLMMNGRSTPPTHVASSLPVQQAPWPQSNPYTMSPLALAQALRPNMNGLGFTGINPPSSAASPVPARFTPTPPPQTPLTPHHPVKSASPLSWSPSVVRPPPISALFPRRGSATPPPSASCQLSRSAPPNTSSSYLVRPSPSQSPLPWSRPSNAVRTPNNTLASSFPPQPTTTSPQPWSPIPTNSPNLNGTLSPTEVKHRLAAALTSRILSSGMNGIGSPADRHGPKNVPPFMSNQPVQQRMPFPGGFNDNNRGGFNENNRGRGMHHHQGPPPPRGHPMFNQKQPGFDPRFPNDRPHGDRFQNGRHPSGDRFPPGDRYPSGPMDDRYGPGDRGFPNGDFHGRHPGDHHMERGRGFSPMDRGGRGGFNGRGRGGFDGPMDHPGRGGFDMRMRGGPPDMRGGRGGFDMRGRGRGGFHHQRWRSNSEADEEDYEMGGGGDRDVFANLMTQKEKDWIIKIQLMQIHTNDPYLDDYYYTKWQMEKLIRERAAKAGSKGEPKLVLPQLAKADGRLYKPVQFEGSLGRLTASSVHNPRQIIDVRVKTNTGDEDGRHKEIRRFKQLLIHIEKSYDLLLEIDDVEKRAMALPEASRPPLYKERAVRIQELYELLHLEQQEDVSFVQLLTVRKGTKLVARTIPFLVKEHALPVVAAILQSILSVIKRDLQDEVMAQLFEAMARVMSELDLAELVLLTNLLITPVADAQPGASLLSFMLQSKFGASLVWSVVSRGEVIFRTVSPVDLDVANQNDWTAFLHNLGEAAAQTPELAQPFYVFPTVPAYLQKQLGMTTYSTLEDRLASALVPTTHNLAPSTPPVVQVAS